MENVVESPTSGSGAATAPGFRGAGELALAEKAAPYKHNRNEASRKGAALYITTRAYIATACLALHNSDPHTHTHARTHIHPLCDLICIHM